MTVRADSQVTLSVRRRHATDSIEDLVDFAATGVVVDTFTVEVVTLLVRSTAEEAFKFEALVAVDADCLTLEDVELLPIRHRLYFDDLKPDWLSNGQNGVREGRG